MGYFDFIKQSEFMICIDSDGCAMDTMEVKHRECFGPQWIYTYGLEDRFEECMKLWLDVNLYSVTRGTNRFKALALTLQEMENRGCKFEGLEEFVTWTKEAKELSNPALLSYAQKSNSECIEKALVWSVRTNRAIYNLPENDKPFDNVKEAMDKMCLQADLASVSSANAEAVEAEWTKHGLKEDCRVLLCQEAGSKSYCISQMVRKGYDVKKIIMVGDAPGDKKAAEENGVWYYPILVGKEGESWARLLNEAFPKLLDGTFDEAYQESLNKEFNENLGV
ncbi:MAG: HAD hydrolase-like protein [Lachnospiraceae bacterium]|nr:HAD hydrolase-like protein [Lachnospiraceae bacterium]